MTKTKHVEQSAEDRAVYGPPRASRGIVSMLCRIMDEDGPRPMRYSRPAQKQRNAADQFDSDHQGPYEARGQQSKAALETVALHNSGYPKMHDELARRRSTAKVSLSNLQKNVAAYNRCINCTKNKKVDPKKRPSAQKCREYKRNTRSRQTMRISKTRRSRSVSKIYRLSKLQTSKGCQCSTTLPSRDKKSIDNSHEDKMAVDENRDLSKNCLDNFENLSDTDQQSQGVVNPDSDPSVSSYNSYGSLENEPMVSN